MKPDQARFLNFLKGIQKSSEPPAKPLSVFQAFDKEAEGENVVFLPTKPREPTILETVWHDAAAKLLVTKPHAVRYVANKDDFLTWADDLKRLAALVDPIIEQFGREAASHNWNISKLDFSQVLLNALEPALSALENAHE